MDGALGADLDLGMDELAHRLLVARAEGGQEAADELRPDLRRSRYLPRRLAMKLLRLIAEARLA